MVDAIASRRLRGARGWLAAAALLLCWVSPTLARAGTFKLCLLYHATTVDSGIGEDYYTSTNWWRARGAKVEVYDSLWPYAKLWPPAGQDPYAGAGDGCVTVSIPGVDQTQLRVRMYMETRLGRSDNITIQAIDADQTEPGYVTILTSTMSSGDTRWIYGPSSQLSNLVAIASFAFYWWDTHDPSGQGLTGSHTFKIRNEDCPGYPGNSCAPFPTAYIAPGHNPRKFAIAHEVGHLVYQAYRVDEGSSASYSFDCSSNVGGPACTYADPTPGSPEALEHALHSMEWGSCALGEGFAHFFATDAFNSHGQSGAIFGYYKYLDQQDPYIVNVENGPTGGVTAYMENMCVGTPFDGRGTELDWLRTFWDYHTNPGSQPGHTLIMDEMRRAHDDDGFGSSAAYQTMRTAAGADGLKARWDEMGQWNGIDY